MPSTGGEPQWLGTYGARRAAETPPPPPALAPPVAVPPSTAEPGTARPMSDNFSPISHALIASRALPGSPAPPLRRAGEGEGGGTCSAMEGAPASVPPLPSPPLPPQETADGA